MNCQRKLNAQIQRTTLRIKFYVLILNETCKSTGVNTTFLVQLQLPNALRPFTPSKIIKTKKNKKKRLLRFSHTRNWPSKVEELKSSELSFHANHASNEIKVRKAMSLTLFHLSSITNAFNTVSGFQFGKRRKETTLTFSWHCSWFIFLSWLQWKSSLLAKITIEFVLLAGPTSSR